MVVEIRWRRSGCQLSDRSGALQRESTYRRRSFQPLATKPAAGIEDQTDSVLGAWRFHRDYKAMRAMHAKSRPLTPAQRRQWDRIHKRLKRNAGRPVVDAGARQIAVTVERELLKRVDGFAKTHKMKRSQIIAQGMKLVMKQAG
jgi:hypothetical protein